MMSARSTKPSNSSTSKKPVTGATSTSPGVSLQRRTVQSNQSTLVSSGPPLILPDLRSQVPQKVRQITATKVYEQFLRIYEPLKDDKILASQDAVIQERKIHEESVNQAGYKQIAAGVLGRLKKRPPAKNDSDIGIDGEWVDPATRDAKQSISKDLQQYILTEEQLAEMNYPLPDALNVSQLQDSPIGLVQQCDRCKTQFTVKDMLKKQDLEACRYHYGRLRKIKIHGEFERLYFCCNGPSESKGCTTGPHVYKDENVEDLAKRIPFVRAGAKPAEEKSVRQIIAYTTGGLELVRISAIDEHNETVLDELVLPEHMVIDLNSRYSGIHTLQGAKYNLRDIQKMLSKYIDEDTILAGHGLENDMKALRIVHNKIVDTANLYPHPNGLPYRYGLRFLANKYLRRFIQDSSEGHDSFEDAKTSLDLIKLKVEKGTHFGTH
ncbi:unnamed protein product [Umbelopsis sp. WA50703]